MENAIMIRINQKGNIMKYRVTLLEVCLNIDEQRISDNATVEPVI